MRTRKGRKIKRYKTRVVIDLDEIRKQVNRTYGLPDDFNLDTLNISMPPNIGRSAAKYQMELLSQFISGRRA